jgi:hypothetical protein
MLPVLFSAIFYAAVVVFVCFGSGALLSMLFDDVSPRCTELILIGVAPPPDFGCDLRDYPTYSL